MAEYEMTLMDRQKIARDTMAFWFDTNGADYEFRAGQHADFTFFQPPWTLRAAIRGPFLLPIRPATEGWS
jgi:ferredoxin-NADP reductase